MKFRSSQKAFTLVEILIATTIFATVMVIVVATISSSMDYRNKLVEIRTTSEGVQKIADMITRDVRETKGSDSPVSFNDGSTVTDYKKGMILLNCSWSPNINCQNVADSTLALVGANTLILFSNNSLVIYTVKDGKLYYQSTSASNSISLSTINAIINNYYMISNADNYFSIDFGGFAPKTSTVILQPYLSFRIESRTGPKASDYDTLPPGMRGRAEIDSSVTMRNYH